MPIDLPRNWKARGLPRSRFRLNHLLLMATAVAGIIVLSTRYERQIHDAVVSMTGAMVSSQAAPGAATLPTVIRPGTEQFNAPAGPNLPTIIKPGVTAARPPASAIQPGSIEVVDGDTVRFNGQKYRLAGIDTPENGTLARCAAEREKAARATERLREIVRAGGVKLERVSCNCPLGTEGMPGCNYGRLCGVLTSAGRDVGKILIGEGLAKTYVCNGGHCPPKQSWCS